MVNDLTELGGYRLHRRLGVGGTGVVYAASQGAGDVAFAVKVLRRDLCGDPAVVHRFQREAALLSSIRHPGIVPVHESGEDQGRHFFVMPLLAHPSLAAVLEGAGPAPVPGDTGPYAVVAGVLRALDAIHQRGVIHRDLTPSNIFVPAGGEPLLADFGIVKILGSESLLTRSGALVGTIPYMAPEQLAGEPVTVRTDVYQVGLVLYRIAAGKLPFGLTLGEAVRAKCVSPALPDPRTLGATIPEKLAKTIAKAVSKEPAARFGSAAELGALLARSLA